MNPITDYLRVSYSSLNVFESCARKFEFQKLYPQRQRNRDAFAADVGTALHHGYQDFLIHGDRERAIWMYMRDYPYALEMEQTYDHRSLEAGLSTLEEMFDSVAMSDYELATIRRPATAIELESHPDTPTYDVPAIEVPFEIRFKGISLPDGRGIAFVGFIDAIMRNLINGRYKTTDIKTHRRTLHDATPKYKFDDQQTPYGIIVEHIQGNPVEEFDIQYLDCFIDVVEPKVTLYPFTRTRDEVQEWLMNKALQFQAIQRMMEMDYFPRTSGGCLFYNRPCPFLTPCESRNREMVEAWLLMGEEPAPPRLEQPWVVAEIDVFGKDQ
jgi:hypothetical protein